ncbi:MAG: FliM/FliN family flagellar motor switch protein [Spirochaetales bacterium]|nr:FliM/FliN family flagellar motor switch protein [Spirochaetales bacterium]
MKIGSIREVKVPMQVIIGETAQTVENIAEIGVGSIIQLDSFAGEPLDLVAAGEKIARGEVVVIDENFGIRVTEILSSKE